MQLILDNFEKQIDQSDIKVRQIVIEPYRMAAMKVQNLFIQDLLFMINTFLTAEGQSLNEFQEVI
jgi:5-carboxymethyl-2-hydroxymuconate isomerase